MKCDIAENDILDIYNSQECMKVGWKTYIMYETCLPVDQVIQEVG